MTTTSELWSVLRDQLLQDGSGLGEILPSGVLWAALERSLQREERDPIEFVRGALAGRAVVPGTPLDSIARIAATHEARTNRTLGAVLVSPEAFEVLNVGVALGVELQPDARLMGMECLGYGPGEPL